MGRHVVGHLRQQLVALGPRQLALPLQDAGGDLDVHLVVRGVDARRVVDGVGLDAATLHGELDASGLGEPQVGAFAHHLDPQVLAVHAHGVVGLVAHVEVALALGLHVGADAAQVEQLGRRLEDEVDDLGRRQRLGVRAQEGADLWRQRDRLGRPREHAAALADLLLVVVLPGRAGQGEHPLTLGVALHRVRIGIDEDVAVVERGLQAGEPRQQHAVAEHVARHVATADDGEGLGLDVLAHLAEVPLHGLPRPAGGDAHHLVVVAHRPARGERVAQPEAVGFGHAVGDVGEGRGALVGRDDQIRIVAVVDDHALRRDHLALGVQVVGDVQQARQEDLVGRDGLGPHGVGRAALGKLLGIEAALRAHRHDHGVLDLLGLHQPQHLGAEVVAPVRPAQAAPGDGAEAAVHALDLGRGDEDLAVRLGRRQIGQLAAGHLERDVRLHRPICGALVEVGPLDGADQQRQAAQHAVVVEALDQLQRLVDLVQDRGGLLFAHGDVGGDGGVELDAEEIEDQSRHAGVVRQRLFLHPLRRVEARLLPVSRQRAHQGRVAPRDGKLHHQAVEAVILGPAAPDGDDGVLERVLDLSEDQVRAAGILDLEVVDPDGVATFRGDGEPGLGQRLQAHVLQDRQHVGERRRDDPAIQLEAEVQRPVRVGAIGAHAHLLVAGEAVDDRHVLQRLGGAEAVAIAGGEGVAVAGDHVADGAGLAAAGAHLGVEPVFPGASRFGDLGFEPAQIGKPVLARREPDDEVDAGQRAVAEAGVVGRQASAVGLGENVPGLLAQVGIVAITRHEQQHRGEPVERVLALEQLHPRPIGQVQDAQRDLQQLVLADLEELVARVVLDDVLEALLVVAARRGAGAGENPGHLLADQRHHAGGLVIGLGGEQADEAHLARGAAVLAVALDADVIHVAAPVDPAAHVRLCDGHRRVADDAVFHGRHQHGRLIGAPQDGALGVAQHAQAVLGLVEWLLGGVLARLELRVLVDPRAQKHEVLGPQPLEELHLVGPRAARGVQFGDGLAHQLQHRREVLDCLADVGQRGLDPFDQGLLPVATHRVEQHLDHRLAARRAGVCAVAGAVALHLDDGVEEGADLQALIGDLAHHAVDEEGRVVLNDLEPVEGRVQRRGDPDLRAASAPPLGEAPEVGEVSGEALGAQLGDLFRLGVGRGLSGEGLGAVEGRVVLEFGL